jgi:hypothetical protein
VTFECPTVVPVATCVWWDAAAPRDASAAAGSNSSRASAPRGAWTNRGCAVLRVTPSAVECECAAATLGASFAVRFAALARGNEDVFADDGAAAVQWQRGGAFFATFGVLAAVVGLTALGVAGGAAADASDGRRFARALAAEPDVALAAAALRAAAPKSGEGEARWATALLLDTRNPDVAPRAARARDFARASAALDATGAALGGRGGGGGDDGGGGAEESVHGAGARKRERRRRAARARASARVAPALDGAAYEREEGEGWGGRAGVGPLTAPRPSTSAHASALFRLTEWAVEALRPNSDALLGALAVAARGEADGAAALAGAGGEAEAGGALAKRGGGGGGAQKGTSRSRSARVRPAPLRLADGSLDVDEEEEEEEGDDGAGGGGPLKPARPTSAGGASVATPASLASGASRSSGGSLAARAAGAARAAFRATVEGAMRARLLGATWAPAAAAQGQGQGQGQGEGAGAGGGAASFALSGVAAYRMAAALGGAEDGARADAPLPDVLAASRALALVDAPARRGPTDAGASDGESPSPRKARGARAAAAAATSAAAAARGAMAGATAPLPPGLSTPAAAALLRAARALGPLSACGAARGLLARGAAVRAW